MKSSITDQLSNIIRCVESDLGTTSLSTMSFKVLIAAVEEFKIKDVDDFFDQFKQLLIHIKSTKPRIGIIIYYFCLIWDELQKERDVLKTKEDLIRSLKNITEHLTLEIEIDSAKIIQHGISCIEENDSILIHSHSQIVLKTLKKAVEEKKNFRVILAEQEEEKTHDMIIFLDTNNIPFSVVPEFMLSHIENEVTKVFLGGITFNKEHNFVSDAGTNSVISEFHHANIPIYMFMTTKKFSLWDSINKHHTYKISQKKIEKRPKKFLTYNRIKFTHDRIPIDLIDTIITEEGIFNPEQLKKAYDKSYSERQEWLETHFT